MNFNEIFRKNIIYVDIKRDRKRKFFFSGSIIFEI